MKRMIVGVDGSAKSRHALTWTADVCDRAGLALVAVRVFNPTQAELSPDLSIQLHVEQRRQLEEWRRSLAVGTPAEAVVLDGDPRHALLAEAHDRGADVLVVGHDRGEFPHPEMGSVARYLTQHTTVPLGIVPGVKGPPLNHIVLGVDGSRGSLDAVELVADLASRLDIGVTAAFAVDPLVDVVPESDPRAWQRDAIAAVRRWTAPITDAGVRVDVDIDRDVRPVAAILRALDAHPGAAACLGLRGLSDVSGMRVGHVARHVLRHTDAALILVPRHDAALTE